MQMRCICESQEFENDALFKMPFVRSRVKKSEVSKASNKNATIFTINFIKLFHFGKVLFEIFLFDGYCFILC